MVQSIDASFPATKVPICFWGSVFLTSLASSRPISFSLGFVLLLILQPLSIVLDPQTLSDQPFPLLYGGQPTSYSQNADY